jgi:hypothetical protein
VSQDAEDLEALNYDAAPALGSGHIYGSWFPEVPPGRYKAGYVIPPSIRAGPTPSASSNQILLDGADADDAQYATYHSNVNEEGWNNVHGAHKQAVKLAKGWVPVPLRAWFWIPLVTFMILLAIGLEIAVRYSNQYDGWAIMNIMIPSSAFAKYYHYAYTSPPVIVSMVLVALWAWVDIEIQRMQPYIDLVHGDAPPERSLLLDYTRSSKFVVWISAFSNRHYMVTIVTLIGLLALVIEPLCACMFVVSDIWWGPPFSNVTNLASISLNQGPVVQDLSAFLSAAGYASSTVLYNFGNPPFIHDVYTVGPFNIPLSEGTNGTVSANTTAVKTDTNCYLMSTTSTELIGGGWTNDATFDACTFSYSVGPTTNHLFGANVMPDCNDTGTPAYFRPIVLWFFTYDTTPLKDQQPFVPHRFRYGTSLSLSILLRAI